MRDLTDDELRSMAADEHSAAIAKLAEYGERIDKLQAEVVRYRAALAQIVDHGPAEHDPENECAGVASFARAALYPEAEEA